MIRQGDILLVPTSRIPADLSAVPVDRGRVVLAYGEATGHAHLLDPRDAVLLASDMREMAERFLRVERETQLLHAHVDTLKPGDHEPLTIPPGDYRVIRQREYAPEAARYVSD